MGKLKVLILNGQYLPGYKGGGPIQSCANMVENLSNIFDFYVICSDKDFKSEKPYANIKSNSWNTIGSANVYYLSDENQSLKGFEKIINSVNYDVIYLNGFFSPIFTIKPLILRRFSKLKNNHFILSPRGDFTGGCENKKIKKYSYIFAAKLVGLYKNVTWHATSEIEEKDIKSIFKNAKIITIPNLPSKFIRKSKDKIKQCNNLDLVFISRIFPKKNLKFALQILKNVKIGNVNFDIYGPMEDKTYWESCLEVINTMPNNINVKYCGEVEHSIIPSVFEKYDAFLFPTLGENYGHVIVEAMANNCLCILSKNVTPWDDYLDKLGLGASLEDKEKFVRIIERLVVANDNEFKKMLDLNNDFISKISDNAINANIESYKELFEKTSK